MIVGLITLFILFSGSGSAPFLDLVKQLQSASKDAIVEADRGDAAGDVLKQMEAAIKDHEKARNQSIEALAKIGDNHAATEAEYRAVFDACYAGDAAFQETIMALYGELKNHVTAQEWATMAVGME